MSQYWAIVSDQGLYWQGLDVDDGATWGDPSRAALWDSKKYARLDLGETDCPSAAKAEIVPAPASALVGGLPEPEVDAGTKKAMKLRVPKGLGRPKS